VLDAVGVITGAIEDEAVTVLAAVPGVAEVEPARRPGIAPPDSGVQ
jgi:hypothetical protein